MKFDDRRVDRSLAGFCAWIDEVFFDALLGGEILAQWSQRLMDQAECVFLAAADTLPVPIARRYRASAIAARVFYGAAKNHFPDAFVRTRGQDLASRRQIIASFVADALANLTSAHDLALLRRLRPADIESPPFRVLHERFIGHGADPDPVTDRAWTVIVRAMAECAGLHRARTPIGHAMATSGMSESRLRTLLRSDGETLECAVQTLATWLRARGTGFCHGDLVDLVLSHEPQIRQSIAMDFYAGAQC
jgi:hypothetical protein